MITMGEAVKKNYGDIKEYVDFSKPLNNNIGEYVDMPNRELIINSGGCKRGKLYYENHDIETVITSDDGAKKPEKNPIRVNEYFLKKDKKWLPKSKTVNGIFCKESFLGHADVSECEGCKFYDETGKAPIYEYKGEVQKQKSKKRQ